MKFDTQRALDEALKMSIAGVCVLVESSCNAECPYCLVQQEIPSVACARCERQHEGCRCVDGRADDDIFLETLYEVFNHVASPRCELSLSGGEPSLSERIWDVLDVAKKYCFGNKVFATNGTGLFAAKDGVILAERLRRDEWTVYLHRDHWDKAQNDALMGYNSLSDNDMRWLSTIMRERLSVNCIVQKGGIETCADAFAYWRYAKDNWGDVHIRFSEIEYDERADGVRTEKSKELHLPISRFRNALKTYPVSMEVNNGVVYFARYRDFNFSLYGCNLVALNELLKEGGLEMVVFPDGKVGWYT